MLTLPGHVKWSKPMWYVLTCRKTILKTTSLRSACLSREVYERLQCPHMALIATGPNSFPPSRHTTTASWRVDTTLLRRCAVGASCRDIIATSMQRHIVTWALIRRCINVMFRWAGGPDFPSFPHNFYNAAVRAQIFSPMQYNSLFRPLVGEKRFGVKNQHPRHNI